MKATVQSQYKVKKIFCWSVKLFQVPISSTFYSRLFYKKVFFRSFSLLTFWLLHFWRKNMSAKGACKMLMKLTAELNIFFHSVAVWSCDNLFLVKEQKMLTLYETFIDCFVSIHQIEGDNATFFSQKINYKKHFFF